MNNTTVQEDTSDRLYFNGHTCKIYTEITYGKDPEYRDQHGCTGMWFLSTYNSTNRAQDYQPNLFEGLDLKDPNLKAKIAEISCKYLKDGPTFGAPSIDGPTIAQSISAPLRDFQFSNELDNIKH